MLLWRSTYSKYSLGKCRYQHLTFNTLLTFTKCDIACQQSIRHKVIIKASFTHEILCGCYIWLISNIYWLSECTCFLLQIEWCIRPHFVAMNTSYRYLVQIPSVSDLTTIPVKNSSISIKMLPFHHPSPITLVWHNSRKMRWLRYQRCINSDFWQWFVHNL